MKKALCLALIALLCLGLAGCGTVYINIYEDLPKANATITMEDGSVMRFVLDEACAPNTVANFTVLANSGFYDGMKIDYIYPGWFLRSGDPDDNGRGGAGYTIDGEFKENGFELNVISHSFGVISMCRYDDDYNSASSQFFIMLGNHSYDYDGKYAAFGYIDLNDEETVNTLKALSNVTLDYNYKPLLRQTIATIRVETNGVEYQVVKSGETVNGGNN